MNTSTDLSSMEIGKNCYKTNSVVTKSENILFFVSGPCKHPFVFELHVHNLPGQAKAI